MTPPDDEDRGAILARRAAFITSTISLLHCSPASERSPVQTTSAASIEATSTPTAPTAQASATPTPADDGKTFEQAIAKAPPRGAPATLPEDIRKAAQDLETAVAASYADAKALWETKVVPCNSADAACKDAWKGLGASTAKLRASIRDLSGGMCGRWSGTLATLNRRRMDHQAFLGALADEIDARLARIARRGGADLEREWAALTTDSLRVPPMPCLRCAPPPRQVLAGSVVFDAGAAALASGAEASLTALLDEIKRNDGATIELVGHADPAEKGDLVTLSKQRADAVATWLKSKGIAANRLRTLGLGGGLPIANDPNENRRVESATLRAK